MNVTDLDLFETNKPADHVIAVNTAQYYSCVNQAHGDSVKEAQDMEKQHNCFAQHSSHVHQTKEAIKIKHSTNDPELGQYWIFISPPHLITRQGYCGTLTSELEHAKNNVKKYKPASFNISPV